MGMGKELQKIMKLKGKGGRAKSPKFDIEQRPSAEGWSGPYEARYMNIKVKDSEGKKVAHYSSFEEAIIGAEKYGADGIELTSSGFDLRKKTGWSPIRANNEGDNSGLCLWVKGNSEGKADQYLNGRNARLYDNERGEPFGTPMDLWEAEETWKKANKKTRKKTTKKKVKELEFIESSEDEYGEKTRPCSPALVETKEEIQDKKKKKFLEMKKLEKALAKKAAEEVVESEDESEDEGGLEVEEMKYEGKVYGVEEVVDEGTGGCAVWDMEEGEIVGEYYRDSGKWEMKDKSFPAL